jgi:hypothetical protein
LLARADFQVTTQNAATLASICYRLDGIPLAIELAAARVRLLSVEEINHKLDQRFRLLTGGSRTALPRQQTLRSLIDWSYNLLHDAEQLLLQRLSVFAGGWTLAAAEQVCAGEGVEDWAALDLLTSLADKSLLAVEQNDGHSRYRLLETVRQYARERLLESGGGEAIRVRHRDYFLTLAEEAEPKLLGSEQAEWLRRLEEEHDNLRSALEWSLAEAESGAVFGFAGRCTGSGGRRISLGAGNGVRASWPRKGCAANTGARGAMGGRIGYHQATSRCPAGRGQAIRRQLGDRKKPLREQPGACVVRSGTIRLPGCSTRESLAIKRELGDRGASQTR